MQVVEEGANSGRVNRSLPRIVPWIPESNSRRELQHCLCSGITKVPIKVPAVLLPNVCIALKPCPLHYSSSGKPGPLFLRAHSQDNASDGVESARRAHHPRVPVYHLLLRRTGGRVYVASRHLRPALHSLGRREPRETEAASRLSHSSLTCWTRGTQSVPKHCETFGTSGSRQQPKIPTEA